MSFSCGKICFNIELKLYLQHIYGMLTIGRVKKIATEEFNKGLPNPNPNWLLLFNHWPETV